MHAVLIGSAPLGDYVPGVSDLDVAAIAPEPVGDPEAVAAPLLHSALPCPARRLELVVYRVEQAAAPTATLEFELDLVTGADGDRLRTERGGEPAHRYLLDLAMARDRGCSLSGPPVRELIGPVPRGDLVDALVAGLRWAAAEGPESPDTVLNACRAARFALAGDWLSKAEAADWAMQSGSDPRLVALALEARRGGPLRTGSDPLEGELPGERVALLVEEAVAELEAAR
ncbi:MAG TPA: aminoglycoside adenylyltransferase domain-containing protein [Thermoleophilaceae bacterium]|jgi:hypothetical protein